MKIGIRQQLTAADCGPTCLGMVLAAHGHHAPATELRDAVGGGARGASLARLAQVARSYGLTARGVAIPPGSEHLLPPGTVLHWRGAHYVVLGRQGRRGFEIFDPAKGRQWLSLEALRAQLTGAALLLVPGPHFQLRAPGPGAWRRYVGMLRQEIPALVGLIGLSLVSQAALLTAPLLSRAAIDRWLPSDEPVLVLLLGVAALATGIGATSAVRSLGLVSLRRRLDSALAGRFVHHLLGLQLSFFLQRPAGDLLHRLRGLRQLRRLVVQVALTVLLDGLLGLGALVLLASLSPALTGVCLLLGAVQVLLTTSTRHLREERTRTELQAVAASEAVEVEMLRAVETLKALGVEPDAEARWRTHHDDALDAAASRERLDGLVSAAAQALGVGGPLLLLVAGLAQIRAGESSLGTVLAVWSLAGSLLGPLASLASTATSWQVLRGLVERAEDVWEGEQEPTPTGEIDDGRIELEGVGLRHGAGSPWVLRGIDLTLRPGEHVALVGTSGSGKSTLLRVLAGLLDPQEGTVHAGSAPLAADLPGHRRRLGIVSQDPHVLAGTVRDNLVLAGDAPDRVLWDALEATGLADDVRAMPLGLDTPVGDAGGTLSGGQRQRLALARALVRRPALLLLDEATSALDAPTERRVVDAIEQLACTRVVVAHRLSTVQRADRIVVLAEGRIVEQGTHHELLRRGGAYARLVQGQLPAAA